MVQDKLVNVAERLLEKADGNSKLAEVLVDYIKSKPQTPMVPPNAGAMPYLGHIHNEYCPVNCRLAGHVHNEYFPSNCPKWVSTS